MDAFRLTKWYLDAVDDQGRSAIAYWTRLAWGPLALAWEGLSLHAGPGEARHRSTLVPGTGPAWSGGVLTWRSAGLGCNIACEPWSEPFESRLLESKDGWIDWSCQAPGATVTIDAGDLCPIRGAGYAERIDLTVLPWRLPIAELRWGRWLSPRTRRSLVWIDWRGRRPLTLVLDRGCPCDRATVDDSRIAFGRSGPGRAGGLLRLDAPVSLYARTISEVLRGLRPLVSRLPGSWRAVEDQKTRSEGILDDGGEEQETGWAIHEVIRLPGGSVSP
jgi:hypothetical protein